MCPNKCAENIIPVLFGYLYNAAIPTIASSCLEPYFLLVRAMDTFTYLHDSPERIWDKIFKKNPSKKVHDFKYHSLVVLRLC